MTQSFAQYDLFWVIWGGTLPLSALRRVGRSGSNHGPVAQWIARTPSEREVVGSSPIWVAIFATTLSFSRLSKFLAG